MDALPISIAISAGIGTLAAGAIVASFLTKWSERVSDRMTREQTNTEATARFIRAIGSTLRPLATPFNGLLPGVEKVLTHAGRPHGGISAQDYLAASVALSLLITSSVGAFFGFVQLINGNGISAAVRSIIQFTVFGAPVVLGYFLMDIRSMASRVSIDIEREFPFLLDLAILVVQAGGTPRQALAKYVEASPDTELAREIRITIKDADATSFEDALLRLADRLQPTSVKAILKNLAQGEKSSGEVEQFYTDQAEELRHLRKEMAARTAERLKANINFPVFLMMTSIIIAALAPTIVSIRAQGFF